MRLRRKKVDKTFFFEEDFLRDEGIDSNSFQKRRTILTEQSKIWTTEDGRKIKISKLENSHLVNIVAMLLQKGFIGMRAYKFYMSASGPKTDAGQDLFSQELDRILKSPVSLHLDNLIREATSRGLWEDVERQIELRKQYFPNQTNMAMYK